MHVVMRSVGVIEQIRHGNPYGYKLSFIALSIFDSKLFFCYCVSLGLNGGSYCISAPIFYSLGSDVKFMLIGYASLCYPINFVHDLAVR
jgi:hypothetical protein